MDKLNQTLDKAKEAYKETPAWKAYEEAEKAEDEAYAALSATPEHKEYWKARESK